MVHCTWFIVHGSLSMVHFTLHGSLYMVHCTWFIVHGSLYMVHCKLFIVHGSLYMVHCTWFIVHGSLYMVHCPLPVLLRTTATVVYKLNLPQDQHSAPLVRFKLINKLVSRRAPHYVAPCTSCGARPNVRQT